VVLLFFFLAYLGYISLVDGKEISKSDNEGFIFAETKVYFWSN
jgi:hypothetical protein